MIERCLIIDEPWIGLTLAGRKTWEMRSRPTKLRGRIGLIRKGSGHIVGVADLVGNGPALTADSYAAHEHLHCIDAARRPGALRGGWVHPWILEDVRRLDRPVPYRHKSGAVIFVKLDEATSSAVMSQL